MVKNELHEKGIKCLVVWECSIKKMGKSELIGSEYIKQIEAFLESKELYREI